MNYKKEKYGKCVFSLETTYCLSKYLQSHHDISLPLSRAMKRPPVGVVWELGERGASSGESNVIDHFKITWSVAKNPLEQIAEQCDVILNQSINQSATEL
ncbi:hypothetical protein TNCV_2324871 [Trichonephila clavipes]|nr:hypothetical protein TNCV_2324871 [Trichonephila clavipes]